MVPGFKYHVATIAAIFFALTAGLVVGSLYVSPQLADGQRRAINSLRDTFKQEIALQKEEINRGNRFVQRVTPEFLKNRLQGETVALVQTGDYPETLSQVRDTLVAAGAEIVSVSRIGKNFNRTNAVMTPALASLVAADPKFPVDRAALVKSTVTILMNEEKSPELRDKLKSTDYLTFEPLSLTPTTPKTVVFIGGSRYEPSDHIENVDGPLLRALVEKGVACLVCEGQEVAVSDILAYRALRLPLSTIDNADTLMGQCALVMAFAAEPDDYGVKLTARQILPAVR